MVQREPTSDLFASFGPKGRLGQLRRLVQDAIDVFEGLAMAHPERYRSWDARKADGLDDLSVAVSETEAPTEISLDEVQTA